MTPEQKARECIDRRLLQAGWAIQDYQQLNPMVSLGVAVRAFPTFPMVTEIKAKVFLIFMQN